ncbi:MAG: Rrf2 family transcriptional regulator [Bdellovibrionales bacterium]|nr:Rrf2 family transcriptional regulator [Bdellovibrionales bacterium]
MLSSASKYSLIILRYLANSDLDSYHTVSEIAEVTNTPASYLSKLVIKLSRAGVIQSKRGARGGIRLNPDAHNRTLFELCELMKDPVVRRECILREQPCTPINPCEYHGGCAEIEAIRGNLLRFLKESRIDDLKGNNS